MSVKRHAGTIENTEFTEFTEKNTPDMADAPSRAIDRLPPESREAPLPARRCEARAGPLFFGEFGVVSGYYQTDPAVASDAVPAERAIQSSTICSSTFSGSEPLRSITS